MTPPQTAEKAPAVDPAVDAADDEGQIPNPRIRG
jgi:hypothetical protein